MFIRVSSFFVLTFVVIAGLSGCAISQTAATSPSTDIDAFVRELGTEGVVAVRQGRAGDMISAVSSARLLLNSRDLVDVYAFGSSAQAEIQANSVELSVQYDVYQRDNLVVIHVRRGDPSVTATLQTLLGVSV